MAVGQSDTPIYGLMTIEALVGNITLSDSKGYIGLVTVTQASIARSISGNLTLDAGSFTGIKGNVTLSDSRGYIGLVTVGGFVGNITLSDSKGFIGLVTVTEDGYSFNNFASKSTVLVKSGAVNYILFQ